VLNSSPVHYGSWCIWLNRTAWCDILFRLLRTFKRKLTRLIFWFGFHVCHLLFGCYKFRYNISQFFFKTVMQLISIPTLHKTGNCRLATVMLCETWWALKSYDLLRIPDIGWEFCAMTATTKQHVCHWYKLNEKATTNFSRVWQKSFIYRSCCVGLV